MTSGKGTIILAALFTLSDDVSHFFKVEEGKARGKAQKGTFVFKTHANRKVRILSCLEQQRILRRIVFLVFPSLRKHSLSQLTAITKA